MWCPSWTRGELGAEVAAGLAAEVAPRWHQTGARFFSAAWPAPACSHSCLAAPACILDRRQQPACRRNLACTPAATPACCSKMKVAHKYPYKFQVNEMAYTRDGKQLLMCTGQGGSGAEQARQAFGARSETASEA